MTQEQEERVLSESRGLFEKVSTNSMRRGARMICNVVLEIAHRGKPYNKRINEIVEFCNTMLGKAKIDDADSGE